jgi:hypothetical protein
MTDGRTCGCLGKRHSNKCRAPPIIFASRCEHADRRNYSGGRCQPCYSIAHKKKCRKIDSAPYKASDSKYRLRKKYGISVEEYEALLEKQKGVCAICLRRCVTGRSLAVDHDHETRVIRGLLCMKCNRAISLLLEDPDVLYRGAEYLWRSKHV